MTDLDPKITVAAALAAFDNVQARLADALDINRASVNEWVSSKREFIPALHAHRLARLRPDLFGEAA